MVKYVPDKTGRFKERPHYDPSELDRECEQILLKFLRDRHGKVTFPVETDDLKVLIERDAEDLDCYADLSADGPAVEGVTEFWPGKKPSVKISDKLTNDPRRENRQRTTLTHEYGHLRFHGYLFASNDMTPDLFRPQAKVERIICKRDTMIDAPQTDWMEWQAGYISGALLMPVTRLREKVGQFQEQRGLFAAVSSTSADGPDLIAEVMKEFQVSQDAARVRLFKLNFLTTQGSQPTLFF